MSIEYPNLDRIINEYFKGNITLDDLVTKYQLSVNQTNFIKKNIIKIVKQSEMLENKEDTSYEDYKSSIIIPKEIVESRKFSESNAIEMFKRMNNLSRKEMNYKEKVEYDSIREELIIRYKPLVDWCITHLYSKAPIPLEDVEMYGYEGLIRAINRFDCEKSTSFYSYALSAITHNIEHSFKDLYGIEWKSYLDDTSLNTRDIIVKKVENESDVFVANDTSESGFQELEEYEDITSIPSENDFEEDIDYASLKKDLKKAVSTLTDRESKVLKMNLGLDNGHPKSLDEIAAELKSTRERIRQIEAKALRKLRHPSRSIILRSYLGYDENNINQFSEIPQFEKALAKLIDLLNKDISRQGILIFMNFEELDWSFEELDRAVLRLEEILEIAKDSQLSPCEFKRNPYSRYIGLSLSFSKYICENYEEILFNVQEYINGFIPSENRKQKKRRF